MSDYAPSEHVIGHGKRLEYGDADSNSYYTKVAGTIDITLPERELGKSETTNDDSPDATKEYTPAIYEPGTLPFTYRYQRSQFTALETVFQLASAPETRATATKYWRVTLPDGSKAVVRGFLTKHSLPVDGQEDSPVVECEVQCIGKMVWTPAA
jgi:hypothetical protein